MGFNLDSREGRTICPHCHKNGKRVVMDLKRVPPPEYKPPGDRFPGQIEAIPAVYHASRQWTCPQCQYSTCE